MNRTAISWRKLNGNIPTAARVETDWFNDGVYGNGTTTLVLDSPTRGDRGAYEVTITNSHEVIPVELRSVSAIIELVVTGEREREYLCTGSMLL